MCLLLLLWPLVLGFSLEDGTQTHLTYDELGSTGGGDGPLSRPNCAASPAGPGPTAATRWRSRTALGRCCWAGCPRGWCPRSTGLCWSGSPPTAWRCGCWPHGCRGCPPPCC
uniref:Uncharacterized protein n=1 Tax=Panthera leo TaxID=9689 RepID=A0A8C8WFL4_PANLE